MFALCQAIKKIRTKGVSLNFSDDEQCAPDSDAHPEVAHFSPASWIDVDSGSDTESVLPHFSPASWIDLVSSSESESSSDSDDYYGTDDDTEDDMFYPASAPLDPAELDPSHVCPEAYFCLQCMCGFCNQTGCHSSEHKGHRVMEPCHVVDVVKFKRGGCTHTLMARPNTAAMCPHFQGHTVTTCPVCVQFNVYRFVPDVPGECCAGCSHPTPVDEKVVFCNSCNGWRCDSCWTQDLKNQNYCPEVQCSLCKVPLV